jgi:hypothetical protein
MIKEFRVLAVSKEAKCYETARLKEVFGCDNPALDVVDTLPPPTVINLITESGWKPVSLEAKPTDTHICIPFVK